MAFINKLLTAAALAALLAASSALAQQPDRSLAGDKVCTACHDEGEAKPILSIYQTKHGVKADARTPGCQTCHGASEAHRKAKGARPPDRTYGSSSKLSAQERSEVCMGCHKGDSRRLHWQGSKHDSQDVACASCHTVHAARDPVLAKATQREVCYTCHKTERAESHRISAHPIAAGKVTCSDCHNTHGSTGPKLMKEDNVRDTCFSCHAEKRGPFLHEHASAMDDCMNCHTPHGSTNGALLKARMPWLCQECHADAAPHPGAVYSGNNLPGGAQANANQTGGLRTPIGVGATFLPPAALNATNPVMGAPTTSNAGSAQITMRGCVNCHSQIHGSNHPGGQRFTR